MSSTVTIKSNDFNGIYAHVKFTRISRLAPERSHVRIVELVSGWKIELRIPAVGKSNTGLFFHIPPSSTISQFYAHVKTLRRIGAPIISSRRCQFVDIATSPPGWIKICSWDELLRDNTDTQQADEFLITVRISSKAPAPPSDDSLVVQRSISRLLRGHDIMPVDVKFFLFSRFCVSGRGIEDPRPLYVSSDFLRGRSEFFEPWISDFSESNLKSFDEPSSIASYEHYDYDSDSDMGYFSEDEDEGKVKMDVLDTTDSGLLDNSSTSDGRVGKVMIIQDVAYVTWRAMLHYLCTSNISFAPLTSRGLVRTRSKKACEDGLPPKPSAKSMYRLADKLGISRLSELSLDHIKSQLTEEIVLTELLSTFTSRYKAVSDVELAYTLKHWDKIQTSSAFTDFVEGITSGKYRDSGTVLSALFRSLKPSKTVKS